MENVKILLKVNIFRGDFAPYLLKDKIIIRFPCLAISRMPSFIRNLTFEYNFGKIH